MRGNEGFTFASVANANSPTFLLRGGRYQYDIVCAAFGTVDLKMLASDGSTQLAVITQVAANKTGQVDLPPGQYQFINGSVTSINERITRIPGD